MKNNELVLYVLVDQSRWGEEPNYTLEVERDIVLKETDKQYKVNTRNIYLDTLRKAECNVVIDKRTRDIYYADNKSTPINRIKDMFKYHLTEKLRKEKEVFEAKKKDIESSIKACE